VFGGLHEPLLEPSAAAGGGTPDEREGSGIEEEDVGLTELTHIRTTSLREGRPLRLGDCDCVSEAETSQRRMSDGRRLRRATPNR